MKEYQEHTCFYCKRGLEESHNSTKPSADHFIPWIFLKTSLVENLVFACSDCNRSKSDRLASFNYFNKLLRRNVPESEFWNDCPVEINDIEARIERWTRNYHQATEQLSVGWKPEEVYV